MSKNNVYLTPEAAAELVKQLESAALRFATTCFAQDKGAQRTIDFNYETLLLNK